MRAVLEKTIKGLWLLLKPFSILLPGENSRITKLLDKIQLPLFILCLCLLFFLVGSAVFYFQIPPYDKISSAFEGGQAWIEAQSEENDPSKTSEDVETSINKRKVTWNREEAFRGLTLINVRYSDTAYLIDMRGKIVHRWTMPWRQAFGNQHPHVVRPVPAKRIFFEGGQVLPNGDFIGVYTGDTDTPWGYGIVKVNKNSKVLWTYKQKAHHNMYVDIEAGKIYATVHYFIKTPEPGLEGLSYPLMADDIVVLSLETGKELDRIRMLNAFKGTPFDVYLYHYPPVPKAPWDFFHTNNVMKLEPELAEKFPMFEAGQLLVSLRNASLIAVIDPETKKVVWATTGPWKNQHHAQFLPNGRILLMDNMGLYLNKSVYTQILEFDPITSGISWRFPDNKVDYKFLNNIYGHVQRLPNGNTLIGETFGLRLIEITPEGKIVWNYKLAMPTRKVTSKGRDFPEGVLSDKRLNAASALVNHHRYTYEELPFVKSLKKDKPDEGETADDIAAETPEEITEEPEEEVTEEVPEDEENQDE
jgi:ribosomal protein L24E